MLLDEAGLIVSNGIISAGLELVPNEGARFDFHNTQIRVLNSSQKKVNIDQSAYVFTEAGRELLSVVNSNIDESTLKEYINGFIEGMLETNHLGKVEIKENLDIVIA